MISYNTSLNAVISYNISLNVVGSYNIPLMLWTVIAFPFNDVVHYPPYNAVVHYPLMLRSVIPLNAMVC